MTRQRFSTVLRSMERTSPAPPSRTDVRFATDADRAAFMREHLEHLKSLVDRYASPAGAPYRVMLAVHPDPKEERT